MYDSAQIWRTPHAIMAYLLRIKCRFVRFMCRFATGARAVTTESVMFEVKVILATPRTSGHSFCSNTLKRANGVLSLSVSMMAARTNLTGRMSCFLVDIRSTLSMVNFVEKVRIKLL